MDLHEGVATGGVQVIRNLYNSSDATLDLAAIPHVTVDSYSVRALWVHQNDSQFVYG